MVKRGFLTAAVICMMLLQAAFGELTWVTDTPGQQRLKTYIETANEYLEKQGEMPVKRPPRRPMRMRSMGVPSVVPGCSRRG